MILGINSYNFTYTNYKFFALWVYKSLVFAHKQDFEHNSLQISLLSLFLPIQFPDILSFQYSSPVNPFWL